MKLSFNSSATPALVLMRVKRMTKASCERAGKVYRKGFKFKKGPQRGKRRGPVCAKKPR